MDTNRQSGLLLLRHGPTVANEQRRIVGVKDVPLSAVGYRQAHELGGRMSAMPLSYILSSSQKRASVTARAIQKHQPDGPPVVEIPSLAPADFGRLEGMSIEEAKAAGLHHCLHTPTTDPYTFRPEGGECNRDLELRILPVFHQLASFAKSAPGDVAVVGHNSIYRCLLGNLRGLGPAEWTRLQLENLSMYRWDDQGCEAVPPFSAPDHTNLGERLDALLDDGCPLLEAERASERARLILHDEDWAEDRIRGGAETATARQTLFLIGQSRSVRRTVRDIVLACEAAGAYGVLHFGSSVTGQHFRMTETTDIDVEIIFDERFEIAAIADAVFCHYVGDICRDFQDFVSSGCDYFSLKTRLDGRPIDVRITHKRCFDRVCASSLTPDDPFVMREFRKQPRANGIVPLRKSFDGRARQWNNRIEVGPLGQMIFYPLYCYDDDHFVPGNNIDKYCSFTECYLHPVPLRRQIFALQCAFLRVFREQQRTGYAPPDADIAAVFIRRERFPEYLVRELRARYRVFEALL